MRQELEVYQENQLLRPELRELAAVAVTSHKRARKCAALAMENIIRAGQALRKLRDLCDDGEWREFMSKFDGSERTVQRYMLLAKHWPMLESAAPPDSLTSQRKALRMLRTLLYGETSPASGSESRPKASGADPSAAAPEASDTSPRPALEPPALEPPAPAALSGEMLKAALQRTYQDLLHVFEELCESLSSQRPAHPLVQQALATVYGAHSRFQEIGWSWFQAPAEGDQRAVEDADPISWSGIDLSDREDDERCFA